MDEKNDLSTIKEKCPFCGQNLYVRVINLEVVRKGSNEPLSVEKWYAYKDTFHVFNYKRVTKYEIILVCKKCSFGMSKSALHF